MAASFPWAFASVEEARAARARETPGPGDPLGIARDVETARDPSVPEGERSAAVRRMGDWLADLWSVPKGLYAVITEEAEHRRRVIGDKAATDRSVKCELITTAALDAMADDHVPILFAEDIPEGLCAPGRFGWADRYRDWLVDRSKFRANRRLAAILHKKAVTESTDADRVVFEDQVDSLDRIINNERTRTDEDRAKTDEARLARLVAALPDEPTRQVVRALDSPQRQLFMAWALGVDPRGRPILLPNQRPVLLAVVEHRNRRRAFEALGLNYSAGQKTLKRIVKRLKAAGLSTAAVA